MCIRDRPDTEPKLSLAPIVTDMARNEAIAVQSGKTMQGIVLLILLQKN